MYMAIAKGGRYPGADGQFRKLVRGLNAEQKKQADRLAREWIHKYK